MAHDKRKEHPVVEGEVMEYDINPKCIQKIDMKKIGWVYVTYAIPIFLLIMLIVGLFYGIFHSGCSGGSCNF